MRNLAFYVLLDFFIIENDTGYIKIINKLKPGFCKITFQIHNVKTYVPISFSKCVIICAESTLQVSQCFTGNNVVGEVYKVVTECYRD